MRIYLVALRLRADLDYPQLGGAIRSVGQSVLPSIGPLVLLSSDQPSATICEHVARAVGAMDSVLVVPLGGEWASHQLHPDLLALLERASGDCADVGGQPRTDH
jgi:hypothetical protein